jgi:hypothetical protein
MPKRFLFNSLIINRILPRMEPRSWLGLSVIGFQCLFADREFAIPARQIRTGGSVEILLFGSLKPLRTGEPVSRRTCRNRAAALKVKGFLAVSSRSTPSCIAHRSLMVSLPGSRAFRFRFVLSLARSRRTGGGPLRPGAFRCRRPPFRLFPRGQRRTSQVPCRSIPHLCRAPRPRPNRDVLASNTTKAPAST